MFFDTNKLTGSISILIALSLMVGISCAGEPDERVEKGITYINQGKYSEAIAELSDAIASNPDNVAAYFNRARAYVKKEKPEKAILDYSKAISLNPNDAQLYYERGVAYYYYDFPDKALSDWSKAIAINPNAADAYQKRAFLYFKKGKYDRSWEDVHKIDELGYKVQPKFLEDLKAASGRKK